MSHAFCEKWGITVTGGLGNDVVENRIWQRRLYDFNVWTDRKRIEKLR